MTNNFLKTKSYYLIAPIISIIIVLIYFRYDAREALSSAGDYVGTIFTIKTFIYHGEFCNKFVGYPVLDTNCFNDYVLTHNYLIILLFRFLGFFTKDPFVVYEIYFYLSILAISMSANYVLRDFKISKFNSSLFAILFSLSTSRVYGFGWYSVGHYFTVPFIILLCYRIVQNKFIFLSFENQKLSLNYSSIKQNLFVIIMALISIISSAYYAYLLIIILILTNIIYFLKYPKFNINFFSVTIFTFFSIFLFLLSLLPTAIFWIKNGLNDIITRYANEAFEHGISISSMLMPSKIHFIESFAKFSIFFSENFNIHGEKSGCSIGLLASIGFLLLLAKIIMEATKNSEEKHKNRFLGLSFSEHKHQIIVFISALNLLSILYFQYEGFHVFVSLFFTNIRSMARFNVFFIFLSYLLFCLIFDEIIKQKKFFKKIIITKFLIAIIAIISFFDHAGNPKSVPNNKNKYPIYKEFVENIEKSLPKGSLIFVTPVSGYPESHLDNYLSATGYIFSNSLRFSYPMPKNRKSHLWQEKVFKLEFKDFINAIKKEGFSGVWIQRSNFMEVLKFKSKNRNNIKGNELKIFEQKLTKISKNIVESADQDFVFYEFK